MQKIHGVLKVAVAASLLSGVVLCGGCARDGILPVEEPTVSDAVGPDHVSVESALAALARFQADDPTTRSSDVPAVSHVDVLMRSEVSPATRTSGTAADAPLCYIAQFEGGGYAVLGADAKQGGVIAYVEGIRAFIPVSQLALHYVENPEDYLKKTLTVRVIEVDEQENRLVLSAREVLREKAQEEKLEKIQNIKVGSIVEGTVESLQTYGAFIDLGDHISGLVHISQISEKRIKSPKAVLSVGDHVKAKVIKNEDGKISLSIKALAQPEEEKDEEPDFEIPKSEEISTSLGSLLKNLKING